MNDSAIVVVFACNWDGLSAIETAAQRRLAIPASVKIIRVSCLSRVHAGLMLRSFEMGADGVVLLGCDTHNCHFSIDEELIFQNYEKARGIMKIMGLKLERLSLVRLQHGDGAGFVKRITEFVEQFEKLKIVKF